MMLENQIVSAIAVDPPAQRSLTLSTALALVALLLASTGLSTRAEVSEQGSGGGSSKASGEAATQPRGVQPDGQKTGLAQRLPPVYRISNWLGKPVNNPSGEQLGTIRDLVMDDYGRFRYVILESEQLADEYKGDRVAVPMTHFRYSDQDERFMVLDATPAKVSQAPSFEAGTFPNLPLRRWEAVVVAYWLPEDAKDANPPATREDLQAETPEILRGSDVAGGGGSEQTGRAVHASADDVYLPEAKARLFRKLDRNDDGAISKQEAQAEPALAEQFQRIDSYHNDRITRSEFSLFEPTESGSR